MKTIKMLALALALIGTTTAANATIPLPVDDYVGISFWIISMGMLAATAFSLWSKQMLRYSGENQ